MPYALRSFPRQRPSPSARRRRPRVALGLALLALFAAETAARAQTPGGPGVEVGPLVTRSFPSGDNAPLRPQNLNPTGISFDDCQTDISLNFTLTLSGLPQPSLSLQAWVGNADCTALDARRATTAQCWPAIPGAITPAQVAKVSVRARDVVAHQSNAQKPVTYGAAGEEACTVQQSPGATALSIYFIWVDGTGNAQGTAGKYDLKSDMVGPPAPTGITAGDGDRIAQLSWTQGVNPDTTGFKVFCQPIGDAPSTDPNATTDPTYDLVCQDGGMTDPVLDDAGNVITPAQPIDGGCVQVATTEAGATDPTCPAPTTDTVCADISGNIASGATVPDLVNGQRYSFAVAGTDAFGNVGPVSEPACATPTPVDDFFRRYRNAGGGAGGCSLDAMADAAPGTSALLASSTMMVFAWLRRRRKR